MILEKLNSVLIRVDGEDYGVRTTESEEHMQQIAALCDEKLQFVKRAYPHYGLSRRYTLAMLEIAGQYLHLKEEYDAMKREIDNLTEGEWK